MRFRYTCRYMSKTLQIWFVRILGGLIGAGTIVLFQNCSAGSLPAGLEQILQRDATETNSTARDVPGRVVGGHVGHHDRHGERWHGAGTYAFTTDGGQVTTDPVAGYVYNRTVDRRRVQHYRDGSEHARVTTPINVTLPSTTPAADAHAVPVPITRYFNDLTQMHMFSIDGAVATAGTNEGVRFQLLSDGSTGGQLFFRCALPNANPVNPTTFFFDTTSSTCEGQATAQATALGYIYTAPTAGAVPLYRWVRQFASAYGDQNGMALDHMDTLSRDPEGPMVGLYSFDSVIGYVLPPPGQ